MATPSTGYDGVESRNSIVVMVEPISFFCNEATCADNYFQNKEEEGGDAMMALAEHRGVYEALRSRGIATRMYRLAEEDGLGEASEELTKEEQLKMLATKPDSIFPNNSISFHEVSMAVKEAIVQKTLDRGFSVSPQDILPVVTVLYPMCPGRRNEIPKSLLDKVKSNAAVRITPSFRRTAQHNNGTNSNITKSDASASGTDDVSDADLLTLSNWCLSYTAVDANIGNRAQEKGTILIDLRGFENVLQLAAIEGVAADGSGTAPLWWALEGTGSLNFSARCDSVFATASHRCHPIPFHLLCESLGIPPPQRFLIPSAVDAEGRCVYHTNVVGWVGDGGLCAWAREGLVFDVGGYTGAPIGAASASLFTSQAAFERALGYTTPTTAAFTLSLEHLMHFAGNAMYLRSARDGRSFLAMSQSAADALGEEVLGRMNAALARLDTAGNDNSVLAVPPSPPPASPYSQFTHIIVCPIPTIERLGGGSVRCLLAATLSLSREGHAHLQCLVA